MKSIAVIVFLSTELRIGATALLFTVPELLASGLAVAGFLICRTRDGKVIIATIAERGGADQPATAVNSKSEENKTKPESEERSQ